MSPSDVLVALVEAGVVLWADDDVLHYRAPVGAVGGALRRRASSTRPGVIALVRAGAVLPRAIGRWPDDERQDFEERAGMLQFEGGLPRESAEREAERLVRLEHVRAFVTSNALVGSDVALAR